MVCCGVARVVLSWVARVVLCKYLGSMLYALQKLLRNRQKKRFTDNMGSKKHICCGGSEKVFGVKKAHMLRWFRKVEAVLKSEKF